MAIPRLQDDGSYLIDVDGELFKHIMCYIKNGVYPLLFDSSKGFYHALYLELWGEVR